MRVNTFKNQAQQFVNDNPGLRRRDYVAAFVEMGMTENSASLYHYTLVTKPNKQVKIQVKTGPVRDPKTGRFMKRAA